MLLCHHCKEGELMQSWSERAQEVYWRCIRCKAEVWVITPGASITDFYYADGSNKVPA